MATSWDGARGDEAFVTANVRHELESPFTSLPGAFRLLVQVAMISTPPFVHEAVDGCSSGRQLGLEFDDDHVHTPKRSRAEEDFRALVTQLLQDTFADSVVFNYADESDADGDFAIDAFIQGPRPIGVAIVANNLAAERAVGSKLRLAHSSDRYAKVEWLSIPRDVAGLTKRTRRRLDHAFQPLVTAFDASESDVVVERLRRRVAA